MRISQYSVKDDVKLHNCLPSLTVFLGYAQLYSRQFLFEKFSFILHGAAVIHRFRVSCSLCI